jgi:hypothetical protein
MLALTVLQDSLVSVQTACVVGQACSSLMTNPAIKVAPLALSPGVDVCPLGRIRGVRPHLALFQNNFDHHWLVCQRKVYRFDRPRRLQSKKLLIQRGVLYAVLDNFAKLDCLAVREKSQ